MNLILLLDKYNYKYY